ncbi:MAG: hypothetical protein JOZ84_12865 [Methylobacteriaceae bacterium]|nr:hypothetical protein [Methylobacteriaceae bacterium]
MLERGDVAMIVALLSAVFSGFQAYLAHRRDKREQADRDPIFDLVVEPPPDPNLFCLAAFELRNRSAYTPRKLALQVVLPQSAMIIVDNDGSRLYPRRRYGRPTDIREFRPKVDLLPGDRHMWKFQIASRDNRASELVARISFESAASPRRVTKALIREVPAS